MHTTTIALELRMNDYNHNIIIIITSGGRGGVVRDECVVSIVQRRWWWQLIHLHLLLIPPAWLGHETQTTSISSIISRCLWGGDIQLAASSGRLLGVQCPVCNVGQLVVIIELFRFGRRRRRTAAAHVTSTWVWPRRHLNTTRTTTNVPTTFVCLIWFYASPVFW